MDAAFKHFHINALLKLSRSSGLYPECMTLRGIKLVGNTAADGGGYGEIWKGLLNGQEIAIKVLRLFRRSDKHRLLKVDFLGVRHHHQTDNNVLGILFRGCFVAPVKPSKCSPFLRRVSARR
jgi:hypothetical protein